MPDSLACDPHTDKRVSWTLRNGNKNPRAVRLVSRGIRAVAVGEEPEWACTETPQLDSLRQLESMVPSLASCLAVTTILSGTSLLQVRLAEGRDPKARRSSLDMN